MPGVGRKNNQSYVNSWKMEPLALAVLAGLTPEDVEVDFFDDRLEAIPYDHKTDLVALNVETYTARRAYYISDQFRRRETPVLLGGYHPTLFPDEAIKHSDAILIGEAENVWSQILEDTESRSLQKIYRSDLRPILNGVKPSRDIFRNKRYLPTTLVESARGCSFKCNFCSVTNFFEHTYRPRPIKEIIKEIQNLKTKMIFFVDDNITCDLKRAKELFRALIPLKIQWISQGSINMAEDEELLSLMKKSGCLGVLIGFESLNSKNLMLMGKQWNKKQTYEQAIKKIRDQGIVIYGTFVFGYDYDDLDTIKESLDFAIKQKFFLAAFNHLVPFPGTPLYEDLQREGRLLSERWWLDPDYKFGDVAFKPKLITRQELADGCMQARREFYSYKSILKRIDYKSNCNSSGMLLNYFIYNIFSKKESNKRQGLPLGQGLDFEGRK